MPALLFASPTTGKTVEAGLETDEQSLASLDNGTIDLKCPRCGKIHILQMKDAKLREHRLSGSMKGPGNAK